MVIEQKNQQYSLQVADFAFQKIHDGRREYEAGKYGKETSNTCGKEKTQLHINFIHFFSLSRSLNETRLSFFSSFALRYRSVVLNSVSFAFIDPLTAISYFLYFFSTL